MVRKRHVAGTALLLVSALLAGCGSSAGKGKAASGPSSNKDGSSSASSQDASSSGTSAGVSDSSATTDKATPVSGGKLTIWRHSAEGPGVPDLFKRYEAATGTKLDLVSIPADSFESTVQTKWATGDRPDILEYHGSLSQLLALNPAQNMQDLSNEPFAAKSGDLYKSSAAYQGKVYGAILAKPFVFGMWYNKATFKTAGVELPKSVADLKRVCAELKQKAPGVAPIYEAAGSKWPTQILVINYMSEFNKDDAYAKDVMAKTKKMSDPSGPFVAGLTAYKELQDTGCFNKDYITGKFEKGVADVVNGKAALISGLSTATSIVNTAAGSPDKADAAVGFVPISASRPVGGFQTSPVGTFYAPKTKNAEREKAARQFIEWATGPGYADYVKLEGTYPAIEGVAKPKIQALIATAMETAEQAPAFNNSLPGFGSFADLLGQQIAGQLTPVQTADRMQKAMEQAAKAAHLEGW